MKLVGKTDEELVKDLIGIHNAENWLGMDGDSDMSLFKPKLALEDRMMTSGEKEDSPSSTSGLPEEEQPQQQQKSEEQQSLKVTVATQTGSEPPDSNFVDEKVTVDSHCYECKVKYRDPKPSDLVMYLHAWRYCGPGWEYEVSRPRATFVNRVFQKKMPIFVWNMKAKRAKPLLIGLLFSDATASLGKFRLEPHRRAIVRAPRSLFVSFPVPSTLRYSRSFPRCL